MPVTRFRIRWPDDVEETCWSPSSVVRDYLEVGSSLPLDDFVARCDAALDAASERVRAVHGRPCGAAAAERARLRTSARGRPPGNVHVLSIHD